MSLFLNSRYELRAAWKFLAFLIVLIPIWFAVGFGLTMLTHSFVNPDDLLQETALSEFINFVSVVLATLPIVRLLENYSLRVIGVGLFRGWAGNLLVGFGIAASLIVLLMAFSESVWRASVEWTAS